MKRNGSTLSFLSIFAGLLLAGSIAVYAQEPLKTPGGEDKTAAAGQMPKDMSTGIVHVSADQTIAVSGLIVRRNPDTFMLQDARGMNYTVTLTNATEVKERKSNPFRGARNYAVTELLRGLSVEVKGRGDSAGTVLAEEIKFRDDDLRVAKSLEAGVHPVEVQLRLAEARLSQAEQNEQRISGQIAELSEISNAARGGAKVAQETADAAMKSAEEAKEEARAGIRTTNDRIATLDDYDVKETVIVNFNVGSVKLTEAAKERLHEIAEFAKTHKGFVIEVAGYASSDGNEALNQRLSQHRADEVIQYLAENHNIPVRRFITPFGYGEKQPVADNKTREGRGLNRRVEVKILVNKGLVQPTETMAAKNRRVE